MDYYYINEIVEMSSLRENLNLLLVTRNKQSLSSQFKLLCLMKRKMRLG